MANSSGSAALPPPSFANLDPARSSAGACFDHILCVCVDVRVLVLVLVLVCIVCLYENHYTRKVFLASYASTCTWHVRDCQSYTIVHYAGTRVRSNYNLHIGPRPAALLRLSGSQSRWLRAELLRIESADCW